MGAPARCVDLARAGKIKEFISRQTLSELKAVLQLPHALSLFPHAASEQIEAFLEDVAAISTLPRHATAKFIFEPYPEDEPYINLAIVADADYIIGRAIELASFVKDSF